MHNASKMLSIMAEKLFCLDGLQRYHKYQSRKKIKNNLLRITIVRSSIVLLSVYTLNGQ